MYVGWRTDWSTARALDLATVGNFAFQAELPNFRTKGVAMGKYLIAWLLGVPGIVLLVVWLFFH
jgi:hypothetical protein